MRTPGANRGSADNEADVQIISGRPDKRISNARARAALLGATLYPCEDDRGHLVFIVTKYSLTRELPTIEATEHWLDRLEGKAVAR